MHIQSDSQAKKSFNAESAVKNVLRVMVSIIIFKNNDILIIINHTVMQRIACYGDSEEQGEESPAADGS